MKIRLFQFFAPTLWSHGGGEIYLREVLRRLQGRGVDAEFLNIFEPERDIDILHIFGSTHELAALTSTAKRLGMMVVNSPIIFSSKSKLAWIALRILDSIVPVPTVFRYRAEVYQNSHLLLPSSNAMARQLNSNFGVSFDRMRVLPLGVDEEYLDLAEERPETISNVPDGFILQVGRISRRKGQVRLIEALEGTGLQVVFAGPQDPDDKETYDLFRDSIAGKKWVHYLGPVYKKSQLVWLYRHARLHVLPSEGEFPGLVSLEAGLCGCGVVSGDAPEVREYFGDLIDYCDPFDVASIRASVQAALARKRTTELRDHINKNYTWNAVVDSLMQHYQALLADKTKSGNQ